jgi:competence protein ComGC
MGGGWMEGLVWLITLHVLALLNIPILLQHQILLKKTGFETNMHMSTKSARF